MESLDGSREAEHLEDQQRSFDSPLNAEHVTGGFHGDMEESAASESDEYELHTASKRRRRMVIESDLDSQSPCTGGEASLPSSSTPASDSEMADGDQFDSLTDNCGMDETGTKILDSTFLKLPSMASKFQQRELYNDGSQASSSSAAPNATGEYTAFTSSSELGRRPIRSHRTESWAEEGEQDHSESESTLSSESVSRFSGEEAVEVSGRTKRLGKMSKLQLSQAKSFSTCGMKLKTLPLRMSRRGRFSSLHSRGKFTKAGGESCRKLAKVEDMDSSCGEGTGSKGKDLKGKEERERNSEEIGKVRRSKRSTRGKPHSSRCMSNDSEDSPAPSKRRRSLQHTSHAPRKKPKNILGTILTDIPEVDICPQGAAASSPLGRESTDVIQNAASENSLLPTEHSEHSSCISSNSQRKCLVKKDLKPASKKTPTDDDIGTQSNASNDESSPSKGTVKCPLPTKTKAGDISTHYRILMSWEAEFKMGVKATQAPVIYAVETISEKVAAIKGPWLNKAKFIWNSWRRVQPPERDMYTARAKQNRLMRKESKHTGKSTKKRSNATSKLPHLAKRVIPSWVHVKSEESQSKKDKQASPFSISGSEKGRPIHYSTSPLRSPVGYVGQAGPIPLAMPLTSPVAVFMPSSLTGGLPLFAFPSPRALSGIDTTPYLQQPDSLSFSGQVNVPPVTKAKQTSSAAQSLAANSNPEPSNLKPSSEKKRKDLCSVVDRQIKNLEGTLSSSNGGLPSSGILRKTRSMSPEVPPNSRVVRKSSHRGRDSARMSKSVSPVMFDKSRRTGGRPESNSKSKKCSSARLLSPNKISNFCSSLVALPSPLTVCKQELKGQQPALSVSATASPAPDKTIKSTPAAISQMNSIVVSSFSREGALPTRLPISLAPSSLTSAGTQLKHHQQHQHQQHVATSSSGHYSVAGSSHQQPVVLSSVFSIPRAISKSRTGKIPSPFFNTRRLQNLSSHTIPHFPDDVVSSSLTLLPSQIGTSLSPTSVSSSKPPVVHGRTPKSRENSGHRNSLTGPSTERTLCSTQPVHSVAPYSMHGSTPPLGLSTPPSSSAFPLPFAGFSVSSSQGSGCSSGSAVSQQSSSTIAMTQNSSSLISTPKALQSPSLVTFSSSLTSLSTANHSDSSASSSPAEFRRQSLSGESGMTVEYYASETTASSTAVGQPAGVFQFRLDLTHTPSDKAGGSTGTLTKKGCNGIDSLPCLSEATRSSDTEFKSPSLVSLDRLLQTGKSGCRASTDKGKEKAKEKSSSPQKSRNTPEVEKVAPPVPLHTMQARLSSHSPVSSVMSESAIQSPVLQYNPSARFLPPVHFGTGVELESLDRQEIEQLYKQNLVLLEHQQRYMRILEQELINLSNEYRKKNLASINWKTYKHFLAFLVEPSRQPEEGMRVPGFDPAKKVKVSDEDSENEQMTLSTNKDVYATLLSSLP